MNVDENSSKDLSYIEEIPLMDVPFNIEEDEIIPYLIPEVYHWTTSLLSEICREGDLYRLRLFIEYSRQMSRCAEHAREIVDRLDVESGLSPLHHAARYHQLHICLMLLSNIHFVFGVNIKDVNGQTPLHSAFRSSTNISHSNDHFQVETDFGDQIQKVEDWQDEYRTELFFTDHPLIYLFAKANGNINIYDKYLLTPLHYAVARKNFSGVKQLITLNANIEVEDRQGIRPLHLACREGYLSIVDYLIGQGAKLNARDADGWTAMHYACANGHFDLVQLIYSKDKFYFRSRLQMQINTKATCLHLAVQNGNIQLVEYILRKLTNDKLRILINQQVQSLDTPLHIAAKFADPLMLDLLWQNGADPLIVNSHEQSPLHIASAFNRLSMVQKLCKLTQMSLLELKDNHGRTALSLTTQVDIVDTLVTHGADISSVDNNHRNVLMNAVFTGQIEIVKYLLSMINDRLFLILDQVDKENTRSVFLIAVHTGSIDMCSLLLTHSSIRWETIDQQRMNIFHIAARHNHHELIQFLCNYILRNRNDSNASILRTYLDAQNEDGKSPLHLASEQGHCSSLEILVHYGANIFLVNDLGQLPFHVAIQNGHSSCVEFLINYSKKDHNEFQLILSRRQSPLIIPCQYGFVDIVQLLISENLGVYEGLDWKSHREENLLEIAIRFRQIEVIHVLLEHPHAEHWLMSSRNSNISIHQTPLREMIRSIPDCAEHALDKLVVKTNEWDIFGEKFERTVYKYQYIDDYFLNDHQLYTTNHHQMYRDHPLIIALDHNHHFLLHHPLVKQLIQRKWKLYRLLFYFPRILALLLLMILTIYGLITPAPIPNASSSSVSSQPLRWMIIILSAINLSKIIFEIIIYRGLRVPFAQLFGLVSFLSSILAFLPSTNVYWQLVSFAILFQWLNLAVILRSVPSFGRFIVMIESILIKLTLLFVVIIPFLIGFAISISMIFYNQSSLNTISKALHKTTAMIIGEFDYEILFFSKPTLTIAIWVFLPFIVIMTIVFINLLLGITVGDIQNSIENARTKANAYWIREVISIESSLPSQRWLKRNLIEHEVIDRYHRYSMENKPAEDFIPQLYELELRKLLDILTILSRQTNELFDHQINIEFILKQLLSRQNFGQS